MTSALVDHQTGEIVNTDDAHERHLKIVALRNLTEQTFLELARELWIFNTEKQYKELGYKSFNEYIADPEVDIGRKTANRLLRVWVRYQIDFVCDTVSLLEAGYAKLDIMIPCLLPGTVTPQTVDEWVEKAAALSRSDLKLELAAAFPALPAPQPPPGIYNVIYADPPWQYDNTGVHGAASHHYKTMPLADICLLPETTGLQFAADAVLFLWVTNPFLQDAFAVISEWGFEYKTNIVWVKTDLVKPGSGFYVRGRHELLYICTRGSFTPLVDVAPPIGSVITAPVQEHSRKPDEVYDIIERLYPDCNYLELFARRQRSG